MTATPRRGRRKHTARELAKRFGIAERTVRTMVAEERAVYEGRADDRRTQIVALHRQGVRAIDIAERLGVSRPLVYARLKEARDAGVDLALYLREETS